MNWYSGDIASAINQAKSRGAIFVVYCEGKAKNRREVEKFDVKNEF
jgi:hypothetical protein